MSGVGGILFEGWWPARHRQALTGAAIGGLERGT